MSAANAMQSHQFKTGSLTGVVSQPAFQRFENCLKQLNAKLVAYGQEPLKMTKTSEGLYAWNYVNGVLTSNPVKSLSSEVIAKAVLVAPKFEITVEGTFPAFAGYEYVGRVDFVSHSAPVAYTIAGHDSSNLGLDWSENTCDHCQTKRYRNETLLIKGADGQYLRVGTSCVDEYLGLAGADKLFNDFHAVFSEFDRELDEDTFNASPKSHFIPLNSYLSYVFAYAQQNGFVSRSQSDFSTADIALDVMRSSRDGSNYAYHEMALSMAEHVEATVDHFCSLEADSDYTRILKIIATDGYCTFKEIGYAASMYMHHQKKSRVSIPILDEYRPEDVKERIKGEILIVTAEYINHNAFGAYSSVNAKDAQGRLLSYTTTKSITVGKPFIADFTIKEKKYYVAKDVKHKTILTNVTDRRKNNLEKLNDVLRSVGRQNTEKSYSDLKDFPESEFKGFDCIVDSNVVKEIYDGDTNWKEFTDIHFNKVAKKGITITYYGGIGCSSDEVTVEVYDLANTETEKLFKKAGSLFKQLKADFDAVQSWIEKNQNNAA